MLRASYRVLKPGGRLAFYTIVVAPGLSAPDYHQRALAWGPPAVSARRRGHEEVLRAAGFTNIAVTDLTDEFLRIARDRFGARERYAKAFRITEGPEFDAKQREDALQIAATEAGLLRRALFTATRP